MIQIDFKEWLHLQEAKRGKDIALEILKGDHSLMSDIQGEIDKALPKKLPTKLQGKLLPLAAYYYADMRVKDLGSLVSDIAAYVGLVHDMRMPVITVGDDLKVDDDSLSTHLAWSAVVRAKQHAFDLSPKGQVSDQELVSASEDGRVKVYRAASADACVILGNGENFCISKPGGPHYDMLRDWNSSTFYFVHDGTRKDDLAVVVVDAQKDRIVVTDRPNDPKQTMQDPFSPEPRRIKSDAETYLRYLRTLGIDTSKFKHVPKSKEEGEEFNRLRRMMFTVDDFASLSPQEMRRNVTLTTTMMPEVFDFLMKNRLTELIKIHVAKGYPDPINFGLIMSNPELRKSYLRARLMALPTMPLYRSEYEMMTPEQKREAMKHPEAIHPDHTNFWRRGTPPPQNRQNPAGDPTT